MRLSLLVKVVLTLVATGLLPLSISFYQLRVNRNALLDQLRTTHAVVARTAAERVMAALAPLSETARIVARTAYEEGADSQPLSALLYATLRTQDLGIKIFNAEGEEALRAQRSASVWQDLDVGYHAGAEAVGVVRGEARRWIRLVEELPGGAGQVVVLAPAEDLESAVLAREIGEEAVLLLADTEGRVLFGNETDLRRFPAEALAAALSGKLRSESKKYQGPDTSEDIVVAFAAVDGTPWIVLSRQPAREAEGAQRRIRTASWFAALTAVLLAAALSSVAWATVIRPLRRLVRAQQDLVGAELAPGGSEIAQLEAAFEILEERVRDRRDIGQVSLGRYRVVEVLGTGAMGTVFKGWDPKLERPVALKTIRLESEDLKRDKLVSTLLKEAKISAGFSHPNIVTVYDAADQGRAAFIAMELIDGIALERLIEIQGRLTWRRTVPLGAAVARGLAAAHEHLLVHQDVKPANILLGRDGSIKVTDFGISQAITSASTAEGVICGTPGYIAPECLEGGGYSPKCDLFALGVVLYECLAGEHPFAGPTLRITVLNTLNRMPAPLGDLVSDLPRELGELVASLLEKNPDRRPDDAGSVARSLDALAAEHGLSWSFTVDAPAGELDGRLGSFATRIFTIDPTQVIGGQG